MDELHRAADKLRREYGILDLMIASHGPSAEETELAVAQAKRVRRAATILLRELARIHDELQP